MNQTEHTTLRVFIVSMTFLLCIVSTLAYQTGRANNIKENNLITKCLDNGGEIKNDKNGLACDK